jgi:hypothetical protein
VSARETFPRVVILYGGLSAEAEISVVSGSAIASALMEEGLSVDQLLITREGLAALLPEGHLRGERLPSEYTTERRAASLTDAPLRPLAELLTEVLREQPDAVYIPALHGPGDESGVVQEALAAAGVAYVGAAPAAARLGMEKDAFKPLVKVRGVRSSGNRRPTVLPLACALRVAAKSGRRPLTLRCSLEREPSLNRTSTIRESLRLRSLNLPMVRCVRLVPVKCSLVESFTTMTRSMRTASHGQRSAQRSVARFEMSCTVRRSASSADLAVEASHGWTS